MATAEQASLRYRGLWNNTPYGDEQEIPLGVRLGFDERSAPTSSRGDASAHAGGNEFFKSNLTPELVDGVDYYANPIYRRPDSALATGNTNASAMGITDRQVDAAIANGQSSNWDAAWYATRVTGYSAWNFATAGFVGRHDDRIQANANGRLSNANLWKATAIDGLTSIGGIYAGGRVGGFVAGRVGSGYRGAALTGAAVGGTFDLALQGGGNAASFFTAGQTGRTGFAADEFGMAMGFGGVLGVGGRYLSEYGHHSIGFEMPPPGMQLNMGVPFPFKLVPPKNFDYGSHLRKLIGPAPEGMVDPHAHHIVFKEGNGPAQKALVREGQALLRRFEIDPIMGAENLAWAPNRVVGQHNADSLRHVVESLKQVEQFGGSRADIVKRLQELGQTAARRK